MQWGRHDRDQLDERRSQCAIPITIARARKVTGRAGQHRAAARCPRARCGPSQRGATRTSAWPSKRQTMRGEVSRQASTGRGWAGTRARAAGARRRRCLATLPAACGTIAAAAIRRSATTEEIVDLLGGCADSPAARRTIALIFVLWRSGLRIRHALALEERDLDPVVGSLTRGGKRGKRRIAGMDPWDGRRSPTGLQPSRGFDSLQSWIQSIAWASTRASSFVNAVFVSRLNAWLFCGRSRMNHT